MNSELNIRAFLFCGWLLFSAFIIQNSAFAQASISGAGAISGAGRAASSAGGQVPAYIHGVSSSASGLSVTAVLGVTQQNLLVAFVVAKASGQSISVADDRGGNWNAIDNNQGAGASTSGLWYCANAPGGTTTITATIDTSQTMVLFVEEYSGVATSSPLDVHNVSSGSGTSAVCPDVTTSVDNALIFAGQANELNSGSKSVDAAYTLRHSDITLADAEKVAASAGAVIGATFTLAYGNPWKGFTAAFKPGL